MPQMHKEYELAQFLPPPLSLSAPSKKYLLPCIALAILLKQRERCKIDIVHMATISLIGKFTCSFFSRTFCFGYMVHLQGWLLVGSLLCFYFLLRIFTKVSEGAVGICVICGAWLNFDENKKSIDEHEPLLLIRRIQPELLSNRKCSIRFGKYSIRFFLVSRSKIANFDTEPITGQRKQILELLP